MRKPAIRNLAVGASLGLLVGSASAAQGGLKSSEDNAELKRTIAGLIAAHNAALPVSFLPEPISSAVAEAVTYGTNIGLKYVKAPFSAPPSLAFRPSEEPLDDGDDCTFSFKLPTSRSTYTNLFGLVSYYNNKPDWGILSGEGAGLPEVAHANSQVRLSVASPNNFKPSKTSQTVSLPAGVHVLNWTADTMIDDFWDIALPPILFAGVRTAPIWSARFKNGEAIKKVVESTRFAVGQFVTTTTLGALLDVAPRVAVTHRIPRTLTVYDTKDPVIAARPRAMRFEATDFGGTLLSRRFTGMRKAITAYDPCDRPYSLSNDAPPLLPIGTTRVKWTVTDRGPNPRGEVNKNSVIQTITVRDTQAPIMVAPSGRVLETRSGGLRAGKVDLGSPRVVDLADPAPRVKKKAPGFFPTGRRSKVLWSTTDAAGNTTRATQWITVKKKGTNRPPKVQRTGAKTLTSKPVDIVLRGSDPDFLDGRFDPLSFRIVRRPKQGEFVAPLYPFFIEDYRTSPSGPFGEAFRLSNNRGKWIYDNYCRSGAPNRESDLPRDFVYQPRFVQVTDDGTTFMIDHYWWCNPSNAELDPRISKWDRDGNYLGQISYGGTNDSFVIDGDGFIYTITKVGAGSSTDLNITKLRSDFDTDPGGVFVGSWKFNYASAPLIVPEQLSYARVDSDRGLLYLNDRRRVFVFDVRDGRGNPTYLGTFGDGEQILGTSGCNYGSSWTGFAMEVDSKGNLYVADTCSGRIHKMAASGFDADGNFRIGRHVGWMGRCEGSTNKACDLTRRASRGYSCTDATCSVDPRQRTGSGQGQFDEPVYLSIDPKDVLYVADSGNARVQRFGRDGSFAGEAVSTGTGVNNGERPSFVLGNMGRPKAVTVNSHSFYVVDVDEQFVHVFKTSPFKKITSDSVTVTYVSRFDFQGTDRFSFRASDGLAQSRAGVAEIKVKRNYRRPRALAIACYRPAAPKTPVRCEVPEDDAILVELQADDPDGVIGKDYLGLDALDYAVVSGPAKGSFKIHSADEATAVFLYRPRRNLNGADRFRFEVSDGRETVKSKQFAILVTPVNDPPAPDEVRLERAARGFPARLVANYLDVDRDPSQSPPRMVVDWGDGTIERQGRIVERGNGEYETTGPLLIPGAPGKGHISGFHAYETAGTKRVEICLTDSVDGAERCKSSVVEVIEATNVAVGIRALDPEPFEGQDFLFEVEVINHEPSSWLGLNSAKLEVIISIPVGLKVKSTGPYCVAAARGAELRCKIGVLAAGGSAVFNISLGPKSGFAPGLTHTVTATLRNPGVDVSDQNMATAMVNPVWKDSDGDGMPDGWELAHGFDPSSPDELGDADSDGGSNLEEYLAASDPRDRRSTPLSPHRIDGVGVYQAKTAAYRLRATPSAGRPQLAFRFGGLNHQPLVGDWNGADGDSIGSYDRRNGQFLLNNRNAQGKAQLRFRFGGTGMVALAGDWDGNGKTSVGVYNSKRRRFQLRDSNKAGKPDYSFRFGSNSRLVPIVGDWNGDGRDSVGHFDSRTGQFLLRFSNAAGPVDRRIKLKWAAGKIPVIGDWDGDGIDNLGAYDPRRAEFLLRYSHTEGKPDRRFIFSVPGMTPLRGGDWNRLR